MAYTSISVQGLVTLPTDEPAAGYRLKFQLKRADKDSALVVPSEIYYTIPSDGNIDVQLWPNARGIAGTVYYVYLIPPRTADPNQPMGTLTVPDVAGPVNIWDHFDVSPPPSLSDAEAAELSAQEYAGQAQAWAETAEDTEVETGQYSSLHHAAKAAASATAAAASASNLSSTILGKVSVLSPPLGYIELPAAINNPLGIQYYWDGTRVRCNVSPYDLIDFTKDSDTPINHYYVNYNEGDDANAGTSTGAGNSWRTVDKAGASAVSPCVIHLEDEWVGIDSLGNSFLFDGDIKFVSDHPSGRTLLTNMFGSYTKATFNWVDEGDGVWSTSAATTSATIFSRLGTMVFDLNYPDEYGGAMPIPDVGSEAALADVRAGQFHDTANSVKYVKLVDGREPDPFDGFIYSHSVGGTNFQQQASSGGTILLEGIHSYRNAKGASLSNIRYRNTNSTSANTSRFGARDVLAYGSSGDNLQVYDAEISVLERCKARWSHLDAIDSSSFVTAGAKGGYQTQYIHDCVGTDAGYDEFAEHTTPGTSENCFTGHSGVHAILMNPVGLKGDGATFAYVNGSFAALLNPYGGAPGGNCPFIYWHEQYMNNGTEGTMFIWFGKGHTDGVSGVELISTDPQAGGEGNRGDVRVRYWGGQIDLDPVDTVYDWDGNALT